MAVDATVAAPRCCPCSVAKIVVDRISAVSILNLITSPSTRERWPTLPLQRCNFLSYFPFRTHALSNSSDDKTRRNARDRRHRICNVSTQEADMIRKLATVFSIALMSGSLAFGAQAASQAPATSAAPAAPSAQGSQQSTTT